MLGWEFPPNMTGGLGTACQGLTEGLTQHGVEVIFVVPREHGNEAQSGVELMGCNRINLSADELGPDSLLRSGASRASVERLMIDSPLRPYMSSAGYSHRMGQDIGGAQSPGASRALEFNGGYGQSLTAEVARYAHAVAELARTRDFDLIHAHDWMTYPAGIIASEVSGKPLVCHVHACEFDRNGSRPDAGILRIEQLGFDAADHVVCVSRYTKRTLERRYKLDTGKVSVVHNAVRARDEKVERRPSNQPIVLFLGRVTGQKGPNLFLDAAARVAAIRPEVRFVISGDGDQLPQVVERAAELGIARRVHFTGYLERSEVEHMFGIADLYVMPSVSEPFGITSLEAMSLDVPVIVSRQSGAAEVLKHALKVDYWNTDDLSDKILAILTYPALKRELVDAGRTEVKRLRWEHSAGSLVGVYGKLLG